VAEFLANNPNAPTETHGIPPQPPVAPTLTGGRPDDGRPRALPTIPGFRVVRELGRGGMGEVYEVVDEKLGVTYALKMIRPDRVSPRFLVRFKREATTMIELDHPHIARIFAYDEIEGCPYFTMKYLPDGTLGDRIESFRGNQRRAAALIAKVARAIDYLHSKGYVHRDLKPQNILFLGDEPFVSDFGLAKAHGTMDDPGYSPAPLALETDVVDPRAETRDRDTRRDSSPAPLATATAGVIGTLPYMSPEQVLGRHGAITNKVDLWALGVLFYELLCGRRPFDSEDKEILSEMIVNAQPAPPVSEDKTVDPALRQIVDRCLRKVPEERYESAAQLAQQLEAWLNPRPPRRIWPKALAGAGLVALLIVLVVAALRHDRPRSPSDQRKAEQQAALITPVPTDDFAGRLLNGMSVEALGPLGKPAYLRWRVGDDDGSVNLWYTDKAFTVTTGTVALLEVLEKPPIENFMFEVEVRLNDRDPGAMAGLYVGHQTHPTPRGDGHFFVGFNFSEASLPRPVETYSQYGVRYWFHVRPAGNRPSTTPIDVASLVDYFPNPAQSTDTPWRKLAVRVTPEKFEFLWDGELFRTLPRATPPHRIDGLNRAAQAPAPLPIDFRTHSAFGLFVSGGSASFQNARITALKP
jgi:serine/threonine protein kinase